MKVDLQAEIGFLGIDSINVMKVDLQALMPCICKHKLILPSQAFFIYLFKFI